jgi:Neprosin
MLKAHFGTTPTVVACLAALGLLALVIDASRAARVVTSASREPSAPAQERRQEYKCVPRATTARPPARLSPMFRSLGKGEEKQYQPIALSPLCPEGQAAVPTSTTHFYAKVPKGNPLLGPITDEKEFERDPGAVVRKSVRPFNEVYSRGRQHHYSLAPFRPDPPPACDGMAYFGSCYYYGSAAFTRTADGGGMTMAIERPNYVSTGGGGHTLDELAVQGGTGNGNIIELGWNVSSDQYGDTNSHLFVYHWKNWVGTCYDGCGWQQYSGTYFPGMSLNNIVGREVYIGYVYYQGNWWAWFDNQWLGYFPGSEWSGAYTKSELLQWFGEVASSNGIPPRTDMGDGQLPSNPSAATNYTLCDVDAHAWVCFYRDLQSLSATRPAYYNISRTGFGRVRYGGPGE